MIKSLKMGAELHSSDPFKYVEGVEFFKQNKFVEFKPGLNVLYGKNGSGKSSLLSIIGTKLAALQGGRSVVTENWLWEATYSIPHDSKPLNSTRVPVTGEFELITDGQGIIYVNPRRKVGLNGTALDDDFFLEGLSNTLFKGSTGETTVNLLSEVLTLLSYEINPSLYYKEGQDPMSKARKKIAEESKKHEEFMQSLDTDKRSRSKRLSRYEYNRNFKEKMDKILDAAKAKVSKSIMAKFPAEIEYVSSPRTLNDVWTEFFNALAISFEAKIEKDQPTIILDEPESGLSPVAQAKLWKMLRHPNVAKKYQIIVATHSPFALMENPDYNLIEMSEGYVSSNIKVFKEHFGI